MQLLCWLIGHRRDEKQRSHDGEDWHSVCKRCGCALVKDYLTQKWIEPQ